MPENSKDPSKQSNARIELIRSASPNHGIEKLTTGKLEDLVDVYEDCVQSWMLKPARALLGHPHSQFAILSIVLPYFESHSILCKGQSSDGKSGEYFVDAFCEVFPPVIPEGKLAAVASLPADFQRRLGKKIYKLARCGLFHNGVTRRIAVGEIDGPIWGSVLATPRTPNEDQPNYEIDVTGAIINPRTFVESIEAHQNGYLHTLRDLRNEKGRERFLKGWKMTWKGDHYEFPPLNE